MREPRPVTRVEISEKNKNLRLIAAVAFLIIGAVGITIGIRSALQKDTGWQRVQVAPQERSCSESFILQYDFGSSGAQATAVNQKLQVAYGDATIKAYQLFTPDEEIAGVNNVWYINRHPNEEIAVDPVLYGAFQKLEGTRYLYLGPVYGHYNQIIYNTPEEYLDQLDPSVNPEAARELATIAGFAMAPDMISLELLGNNTIKLHVAQEYLTYGQTHEIHENFIDFAYMTNAFIIDYLADTLIDQDLTDGYLVSADGYTRNLTRDMKFRFNIFDRIGNTVYPAGMMEYRGPVSLVYLKDYPTADSDTNYRGREDRFVHLFADPVDGMYRTSCENLVCYSYAESCADVLLKMLPSFLGGDFSLPEGVYSIWCEENLICYNDDRISIRDLLASEDISYRAVLQK